MFKKLMITLGLVIGLTSLSVTPTQGGTLGSFALRALWGTYELYASALLKGIGFCEDR